MRSEKRQPANNTPKGRRALFAIGCTGVTIFMWSGLHSQSGTIFFGSVAVLAWVYTLIEVLRNRFEVADMKNEGSEELNDSDAPPPLGVIGNYQVDGDTSLGMFVVIGSARVFVDLRQDALLPQRKDFAALILANSEILGARFRAYAESSRQWSSLVGSTLQIETIGCYRSDPMTAEVYLTCGGSSGGDFSCLLENLEFKDL